MVEPIPDIDASGLLARMERVAQQAQEQQRAEFKAQLDGPPADSVAPSAAQGALPFPPGFVGALAQFVYQSAPRPVAEVAVVAALGLMAGIAGREWHIPGSGLNLYIVLVARSAIGKEAMHSGIAMLVTAAAKHTPEAYNAVDFNDHASGPALVKICSQRSCFVNVAGEIGHKFLAMAKGKEPAMLSLRKTLTTYYSKSGPAAIAGGISYSSTENNVEATQAVAFSLIGETTPGTFYESITDTMILDGFMSRFCVIEYTGDRPPKNVNPVQAPPKALVDQMVAILTQAKMMRVQNHFQEVAFSDETRAQLEQFENECDAAIIAAGDDENVRQLWNRAHLKALRTAALLAVGDNPYHPTVSSEQAAWPIHLMRHGIAAFAKRIRMGEVGEGTDSGREQKVIELCREYLNLPPDKMPDWLKGGIEMQQNAIVPRKYLQRRTQRLAAFENHPLKHTAALNMAIKTAISNGNMMDVKPDKMVEICGFHGQAFRMLCLN